MSKKIMPLPPDNQALLEKLLNAGAGRVHCMGIGGVGMAGLAFLLRSAGWQVDGCDLALGHLHAWLEKRDVPVQRGHAGRHLRNVDWVVRSSAVPPDQPELQAALAAGLPVFRRGAVLAALARRRRAVAVCGTHGKTTTAAMLVQVLRACGLAPDYCIGGECPALDGPAGTGDSGWMVIESDESDGTLRCYHPEITLLTNVEFDHAEYYPDIDALDACFAQLAGQTGGAVVYCGDDAGAVRAAARAACRVIACGCKRGQAWRIGAFRQYARSTTFNIIPPHGPPATVKLPAPGRHNARNAALVCAAAHELGLAPAAAAAALANFVPVNRRFQALVDRRDMRVFSDYAHHPTEIRALLSGLSRIAVRRWRAVFQPHRFSRTRALTEDFAAAFRGGPLAELLLAPVYAASESSILGGDGWDLYAACRRAQAAPRILTADLAHIWEYLRRTAKPGDGLLVIGAGDVDRLAAQAGAAWRHAAPADADPVPDMLRAVSELPLGSMTRIAAKYPLAGACTLRVGGAADVFAAAGTPTDLQHIVAWARSARLPLTVLGNGSNMLISDLGIRGVTLRLRGPAFARIEQIDDGLVAVGAAVRTAALLRWCLDHGRGGAEFLHGIPGTLGGAVRMNAGAWGAALGDLVHSLRVMDRAGNLHTLKPAEIKFAYRRAGGLGDMIVLNAVLRLDAVRPRMIAARLAEIDGRRRNMRWRFSAGSVFRNPPGDYAGRLLEAAGCGDMRVGGARFAATHANVIVAAPGATTAADVLALAALAAARVRTRFKVELEKEIVYCE